MDSLDCSKPKKKSRPRSKVSAAKYSDKGEKGSTCSGVAGSTDMAHLTTPAKATPSHTTSHSWKSAAKRRLEEFSRIQRLIKHIAPEQFRNPAWPSNGPCNIVPTDLIEYVEHSLGMLAMATDQLEKNLTAKKEADRIKEIKEKGEIHPPIESKLGANGKVFVDAFSPVLCQPTIWCIAHDQYQVGDPKWPTLAELQECGDRRENDRVQVRCGRHLPLPRERVKMPQRVVSHIEEGARVHKYKIKRLMPMDEAGPVFRNGPAPTEFIPANVTMNTDPEFEGRGQFLLGSDMMAEIGEYKPPFVPPWLAQRRHEEAYAQALALAKHRADSMISYLPYMSNMPYMPYVPYMWY